MKKRCVNLKFRSEKYGHKRTVAVLPGPLIHDNKWQGFGKNCVLPYDSETCDKFEESEESDSSDAPGESGDPEPSFAYTVT